MREFGESDLRRLLFATDEHFPMLPEENLGNFISRTWHLAGYISKKLREEQHICVANEKFTAKEIIDASIFLHDLQRREMHQVTKFLDQRKVTYALLKGTATAFRNFSPGDRILGDLDIAITPSQIFLARETLEAAGYFTCGWDRSNKVYRILDRESAAEQERGHYQLAMLVKRRDVTERVRLLPKKVASAAQTLFQPMLSRLQNPQRTVFAVEIDLHHSVSAKCSFSDELTASEILHSEAGDVRVCNYANTLAHTLFKLYYEGVAVGKGGHQYSDVFMIAASMQQSEWIAFWNKVKTWQIEPAAYYVLRRIVASSEHLGPFRLRDILRGMRTASDDFETRKENSYLDYGDPWDKIWGWDVI